VKGVKLTRARAAALTRMFEGDDNITSIQVLPPTAGGSGNLRAAPAYKAHAQAWWTVRGVENIEEAKGRIATANSSGSKKPKPWLIDSACSDNLIKVTGKPNDLPITGQKKTDVLIVMADGSYMEPTAEGQLNLSMIDSACKDVNLGNALASESAAQSLISISELATSAGVWTIFTDNKCIAFNGECPVMTEAIR